MESPQWGVFRLKGLGRGNKTYKARPLDDGSWAVIERGQTGKTVKIREAIAVEGDTCMSQQFVPEPQFLTHYVAVDTVAREMLEKKPVGR